MTSKVTAVGKTVDEAVSLGLNELGVSRDQVEVNVLEHPSKKFLGLFGGRKAKVELTLIRSHHEASPKLLAEEVASDQSTRLQSPNLATPKPMNVSSSVDPKSAPRREQENSAIRSLQEHSAQSEESLGTSPMERYHEAADFIRDVAETMGLHVEVDVRKTREGGLLDISGPELGMLIGRRGQTLDALQLLASVVANKDSDKFVRLTLDAENFRRRRAKTLEDLADRLAERVVRSRKEVVLEPMPPQERKVIHARLQNHPGVNTGSRGEEPNRRVVITLK
ncbi:RNA-binding cell elongation regulator Jag/EloR [Saccharibacillus sp. JS10]|uniref:RNA-binding cell elongation regulator Jag/EloR n=1 Tax=Saccharibacillus sp. JS10 TaxID=2950552 RepID=UPI00210EBEF6|nr:RNA-binding cell elongation regulator Jag/EloR [Saccharibacillus sp. JS10]MCQ4087756.1 protein jag [Saccharibacillus sp. JS10]